MPLKKWKKKGGKLMACKHERVKSVNCELFCLVCGEKLPDDFLKPPKEAPAQEAEPTKKPARKKVAK